MKLRHRRLLEAYEYVRRHGYALSQAELADAMCCSAGTVNGALNCNPRYLTDNFLQKFNAAFLCCFSEAWLLRGEGQMLTEGVELPAANSDKALELGVAGITSASRDSEPVDVLALRQRLGYPQPAMARLVGVSTRTLQAWEAGENVPTIKLDVLASLQRLCSNLPDGVTLYGLDPSLASIANSGAATVPSASVAAVPSSPSAVPASASTSAAVTNVKDNTALVHYLLEQNSRLLALIERLTAERTRSVVTDLDKFLNPQNPISQ